MRTNSRVMVRIAAIAVVTMVGIASTLALETFPSGGGASPAIEGQLGWRQSQGSWLAGHHGRHPSLVEFKEEKVTGRVC